MRKSVSIEPINPKRVEFVGRLAVSKSITSNNKEFILLKFDTSDGVKSVSSNEGQLSKFTVKDDINYHQQLSDRFVKVICEEHIANTTTYVKEGVVKKHRSDMLNLLELIPIDDEAKGLHKAREASDVLGLTNEDKVNFILRYLGKV